MPRSCLFLPLCITVGRAINVEDALNHISSCVYCSGLLTPLQKVLVENTESLVKMLMDRAEEKVKEDKIQ